MIRNPISRRSLLTGIISTPLLRGSGPGAAERIACRLDPTSTNSIRVVDYRLVPGSEVDFFIVEIRNFTDDAIDTPALGVTLPHLDPKQSYGWATPMQGVLHPHSSAGLIGVAPAGITRNDDWGTPDWIKCGETESGKARQIAKFNLEFSHTLEILGPHDVMVHLTITNGQQPLPANVTLKGLVRDHENRICGVTLPIYLNSVGPGETEVIPVAFGPAWHYLANPGILIDTERGLSIDFSLQPFETSVNTGCPPLMPWNR